MTITTLEKSPKHRQILIKLIEKSFDYNDSNNFDIDFFPLMSASNSKNCYIMLDLNDNLIGHIGLLPRIISNNNIQIPVTFIGGIVVDPQFQHKGYFRELLNHVIKIHEKKSSLYILWSHLHELYEKFDFYPAIGMLEHTPDDKLANNLTKTLFKNLDQSNKEQIKNLYNQLHNELSTVLRDDEDWKNIEKITSTDLFFKTSSKNEIEFYYFKNKGQDLSEVVHEFGYKDLIAKEELFKILQSETSWLPENSKKHFPKAQLCSSALVRIGDNELFQNFVHQWTENQITILNLSLQEIEFEFQNNLYDMTINEFLPLILGPNPALEFIDFGKPLFISGLDSI